MAATQTMVICDKIFLGHVIFEFLKVENKNGSLLSTSLNIFPLVCFWSILNSSSFIALLLQAFPPLIALVLINKLDVSN